MWAPFHGPLPPWRFVVLGKAAQVEMQQLTLSFYDKNWRQVGFMLMTTPSKGFIYGPTPSNHGKKRKTELSINLFSFIFVVKMKKRSKRI